MKARSFDSIAIGETAAWRHCVTADEVDAFAALSGDCNPLHMDDAFARRHGFRGRVVHGMLVSSFLSRVLGTELPGPGVLWMSQNTRFPQPVYVGDEIEITVRVVHKSAALRSLVLETTAVNQQGETVLAGEAKTMMLEQGGPQSWDDTVAVVTGGSRGIGAAIARALGRRRARVVVNYQRNHEAAAEVVAAVAAAGGKALAVQADVSLPEGAARLADAALEEFGRVSVLVHNASPPIVRKPFVELAWDEVDAYWRAYVQGAFMLVQRFVPGMKEAGFGRIVNILSTAACGQPPPDLAGYVAAKSGLWGLTKALAIELAPHGITVNAVSPSAVMTDQWRDVPETRRRAIAMRNPLRRLASADDVAAAVLYLIGPSGAFTTGLNLPVAGGEVMG